MKRKKGLTILSLLLAAFILLSVFPAQITPAVVKKSGNGIAGNGTWGIKIDIYSSPFTDYANPSYSNSVGASQYAYGSQGCAWFAASRVKQITGVDCIISSGVNWYQERYAWYGFSRGTALPTGKALACFGNHVNVIEAVQGDQYLVSEGGYSGGGAYVNNDYCVLHVKSAKEVKYNSTFGEFYGFVYLTDNAPVFRTDQQPSLPTLTPTANGISLSWNKYNMATGYRVYRKEKPTDSWTKLVTTKNTSYTDTSAQSGKMYYYTVRAYNKDSGSTIWSKYNTAGISGAYLAPSAAVKTSAQDGKIVTTVSAVTGAKEYILYRKVKGGAYQKLTTLSPKALTFTDRAVTSGTTYVYRVRPYAKVAGSTLKAEGTSSAEVMAYTTPKPPVMTAVYESVSSAGNSISATLWFEGNGSNDYTVYRREKGKASWKKVKTVSAAAFSRKNGTKVYYAVQDKSVRKGKTYEYTVGCHRVVGPYNLNSAYGTKKIDLNIVDRALLTFLSDFQSYGSISKSKTRVYRYWNSSNKKRLLKALYADPAAYNITNAPNGTRNVITGSTADPYRKFKGKSYVKVKETAIRWAATNIFHCDKAAVNNFRSALKGNREKDKPYIRGSYYYLRASSGKVRTSPRILSLRKRNGFYYVKYRLSNNDGSGASKSTQCAVLKKERKNGKVYWTLYTHNTGKFLAP